MLLTGCNHDELAVVNDGENPIKAGEQILFTSMLPDEAEATRTKSEWETEVKKYSPVNHDYTFSVIMWKKDAATASGTSTYRPLQTTDVGSSDISGYDGTLKVADGTTPLYWQDNVSEWGFKAEANHSTLESDQSTQEKWLAMDYLKGHSYLPVWTGDEESGSGTPLETTMYLTSKDWYKTNQQVKDLEGLMVSSQEDYKKIPLYMQHQRAWITVILRAGEGVTREALAFEKAAENIRMAINSYTKDGSGYTKQEIGQPWASEYFIDYGKDVNGEAATHVSTTRYDAIVEPHNYGGDRKEKDVIAKINLSNQNFSFYASNDTRFVNDPDDEDEEWKAAYNLQAGKHLTVEVTLSRESRKILITAWIEDWTEVVTSTICDDYGQNGDPVVIKNRAELIAFLTDPKKNCQGSVGIIQPNELALDVEGAPWPDTYDLNATLNLAGCKLVTGHRIFKSMTSSANLVNGTISITDGAELDCAIALKNEGTIERVQVVTSGENSTAKATLAGMVGLNTGTIYQCSSTLPVYATDIEGTTLSGYVGGIAAVSQAADNTSMAVIDGCTVNASVNGTGDIKGGGIVGYATGRISNNLFEYGITVKQNATDFKNIFGMAGNTNLRAYNNRWPTKATNPINDSSGTTNPNNYPGTTFDAVIDCENELHFVIKESNLNDKDKNYRISKSFAVSSDTWKHGKVTDDINSTENILFNLDGNDKTITLTGNQQVTVWSGSKPNEGTLTTYTTAPMLFNYVKGEIKDLTLYLDKPIVAVPSVSEAEAGEYNATDAIAPLAYAVYGTNAKLSNIKVKAHKDSNGKNDVYVQAATPAGLVVWAFGGATVTQCKVQVPVKMWLPSNVGNQGRHYAGGIVACAAEASISESVYLVQSNTALGSASHAMGANHYYGGIVGGTSKKDTEIPSLQIADCTSWFAPVSGETGVGSRGSVIGFACYTQTDQGSALANGMDKNKKSEGNWWPLNTKGAYTWADGYTEEMVIGKRNAVSPTHEDL